MPMMRNEAITLCNDSLAAGAVPLGIFDRLPVEVLAEIIADPEIGSRELCRLEQCSSAIRALVLLGDGWQWAFLRCHRPPVLGIPKNWDWKDELVRRRQWSLRWRQQLPSLSEVKLSERCVTPTWPKKMLHHISLGTMRLLPSICRTHADACPVVDPANPNCFASVNAAIAAAKPHDTVLVAPGTYFEHVVVRKSVDVVGMGPIGSTRLVGVDEPVVQLDTPRVECRFANLCIEQRASSDKVHMSGALRAEGGAAILLEDCSVSSAVGHCIVLKGCDTVGYLLHNTIQHAKGVGVLYCEDATGLAEDNDVSTCLRAGVAILSGSNPVVRCNRIHGGGDSGVLVSQKGAGRIEHNEIFANQRAGVAILRHGDPIVAGNRIFDGFDSGVLVCMQGQGTIFGNEIFANQRAAVAIHGGRCAVHGNTIGNGRAAEPVGCLVESMLNPAAVG